MLRVNKDNIIYLLIGALLGIFITVSSGVILYKVLKNSNQPKQYEPKKEFKELKSSKKIQEMKGFNLSFEKTEDLDVFTAGGKVSLDISENNPTHGKHSLMVKIEPGSGFPGLLWEAYGKDVQDWQGAKDFHFDVYNNNEDYVKLEVKFKSGENYPKKSYSYPVELEPLKMNHITIPMNKIAETCDITQMSYVKIFAASPKKEIVLFFDNIGIGELTKTDEVSKIKNKAVKEENNPFSQVILKEGLNVFVASSLDRIFQNGKTLLRPTFTESATISLAKNEYESFQVVVSNGKDILKSVGLEISDFVDENTRVKIDNNNITWRVVGYVETKKPYYPVKFVGMWPDPLLPAQNIDINPGIAQPFWVTVYIPNETQAGIYKGKIKVMSNGRQLREISVSIKVNDFTLPLESHLKTAFDFYAHITDKRYPKQETETKESYQARISGLNEKYIIDMLKHRINPILNINPLSQKDLNRVYTYLTYGLNNFSIGKKGGTFSNNWPKSDEELEKLIPVYQSYAESLKSNKILNYSYIYTWDEGKIGNPQAAKVCSMIHKASPELKNMVCYHGFWEPKDSPGWGKDINIWCFQIGSFNESKIRALKELGMEIWMYVSGPGGSGSPNLAIDFDAIDYRIIPWLCWKYDIKGFLYWCVNWWPYVDPFESAANTKWSQNGNGLLYYPGESGPIDSLRLEIFRDGMEDYEYLYLLAQKIKAVKDKNLEKNNQDLINKAKNLLNIDGSIASAMSVFTKDSEVIYKRRQVIAEAIESLDKVLSGQNSSGKTLMQGKSMQAIEDFSKPVEAVSGKSFGGFGQLTFELYRDGTFIIDGKSGYAWQKSDSYRDVAIIRSTGALPKTYKISAVVGDIDYDLAKIEGLPKDPEYTEGPKNENGCYLLAITDEAPIGHHTNDWWHQHRKVCIDVDNNVWGHGMPNPIFMVLFDQQNRLMSLDGQENKWVRQWRKAATYQPDAWYKVEIEKTDKDYRIYLYNAEGKLIKGGVIPFKYVLHADDMYPDYLVIGDPHENYYQGSMKIRSISMPVTLNKKNE